MTKLKQNKIWLVISIFIVAICAALFATIFATADEPEGTYSIHGTIKNFDTKATMSEVNVGRFIGVDSEDVVKSGVTGEFTINNVPCSWTGAIEAGYGEWDKYAADKVFVQNPGAKDTTVEVGDIYMHSLNTKISGHITDEKGQPLKEVYLEFYNPNSPISPSPDIRVFTDKDGYFILDEAHTKVFDPENHYKGLGIGLNYTVSVMSVPTTWPAQNPKNYPTNLLSQTCDFTCTAAGTDSLNFQMTRIINIRINDWDQGETTFFDYFHHAIYVNGVCEDDTATFGDTKLTIAGDFTVSIEADCILKLAYSSNGDDVVETFEPYVVKSSKGWIPGEQLKQYKAVGWVMNNVWGDVRPTDPIKIGYNNKFSPSTTRFIDLDVDFIEDATPASIDTKLTEGHGYFHYVQTINGKTYEYNEREFHQGNFFKGTEINIDENNNLVYSCEFPNSNANQRTVVTAVPANGFSFVGWTNNGDPFTSESETITAEEDQINLGVIYESNSQSITPQTGDANGPLIIILAVVLALAIIGLISYFVINKVKKNKTKSKHRKH